MSWHFSQALEGAYSAENSSGGEPYAQLSSTDTPEAFSWHGKTTDALNHSQSGTTCEPSTDEHGEALLTWFLAGFHARTSAQPEKAQASQESAADSGNTWRELSAKWDRASSSWKTHRYLWEEDLPSSSVILPRWGMMHDGVLSERITLALPIEGTGSGLWPTPTVCGNYNRKGASKTSGDGLATAVKIWPTPTAHNAKECNAPSESERNTPTLASQAGGKLNPNWVEWLMAWPIGWTALEPLETGRFQAWLDSHGTPSQIPETSSCTFHFQNQESGR